MGVGEGDVSAGGAGAVYLFGKAGGAWSERVYAKASNPDPLDGFGYAVALSADASALAVGAPNEASGSRGIDVTGGMLDKVRRNLALVQQMPDLKISVIGTDEGLIERGLSGQAVGGTWIHADSGFTKYP